MNTKIAAISIVAADTSSWVLIGLPALIYGGNNTIVFIPIGLLVGLYFMWKYIASTMEKESIKYNTNSIIEYFSYKSNDSQKDIRKRKIYILASVIVSFYFFIYIASGLKSGAMMLCNAIDFEYKTCLVLISIFVLIYTLTYNIVTLGYSDILQAFLIFMVMIIIPFILIYNGGLTINCNNYFNEGLSFNWKDTIEILSHLAWGFGYFGQPHVLSKFMSMRSKKRHTNNNKYTLESFISLFWLFIVFLSSIMIGVLLKNHHTQITNVEDVFFIAAKMSFGNKYIGICFAALLAAITSTILSQVIILSDNFIKIVKIRFLSVFTVLIISFFIAFNDKIKVTDFMSFAWSGFGASFGPVLIYIMLKDKILDAKQKISQKIYEQYVDVADENIYNIMKYGFCINILIFIFVKIFNIFYVYELLFSFIISTIIVLYKLYYFKKKITKS